MPNDKRHTWSHVLSWCNLLLSDGGGLRSDYVAPLVARPQITIVSARRAERCLS